MLCGIRVNVHKLLYNENIFLSNIQCRCGQENFREIIFLNFFIEKVHLSIRKTFVLALFEKT